ncbi:MAG: hypothetical protein M3444_00410 [Acidobacteriota bacterium]|nr:hypothetical protein [Acidobacteriota bacterium]
MSAVSDSIDELDEQGATAQSAAEEVRGAERVVDYVADPEQTVTNHRLLGVLGVLVVLVLVQAAFNLVLYLRRPDTIVVDRTAGGDRVVVMNNREYGLTDNVQFSPDRLTDGDKKYLASYFLKLYYGNNPDYRDQQLNEAIGLMVAARGRELFNYLKQNRVLEQQAAESWQAKWTEQQVSVDATDPFTVHVIGLQQLTRIINQRPVDETHQLNVTVKLARDELGRDERNKRTGYQVTWFGWDELKNAATPGETAAGQAAVPSAAGSALQGQTKTTALAGASNHPTD